MHSTLHNWTNLAYCHTDTDVKKSVLKVEKALMVCPLVVRACALFRNLGKRTQLEIALSPYNVTHLHAPIRLVPWHNVAGAWSSGQLCVEYVKVYYQKPSAGE